MWIKEKHLSQWDKMKWDKAGTMLSSAWCIAIDQWILALMIGITFTIFISYHLKGGRAY